MRAWRRDTSDVGILTWASRPRPTTFSPSARGRIWRRQSSHRAGTRYGRSAGVDRSAASDPLSASPANEYPYPKTVRIHRPCRASSPMALRSSVTSCARAVLET
jgi:hypothetical protein